MFSLASVILEYMVLYSSIFNFILHTIITERGGSHGH